MPEAAVMPAPTQGRDLLLDLYRAAVDAVSPAAVMPADMPRAPHGRVVAIAVGKAAAEMMRVARSRSRQPLTGLVVTRYGHVRDAGASLDGLEVIEAGHPYPDDNSIRAAGRALDLARSLEPGDLLLVLMSGGGSAMLAAPAPGVSLADK